MASPLFEALSRFRSAWLKRGWSYDNRFNCVASTFDADHAQDARNIIATTLPHAWSDRTLPSAPAIYREVAKRTGGVRSAQMIFGAEPVGHLVPYGLWWPWEEGRTISLRVGLDGASQNEIFDLCMVFGTEP